MIEEMDHFARQYLKDNLNKISESGQLLFKRMYSPDDIKLSVEDVVDKLPEEKLDWAMQQVKNTLERRERIH